MPTHSVLPEDEVHQRVRERLESGRLPVLRPDHIHAGYLWQRECSLPAGASTAAGALQVLEKPAALTKSPQYSTRCEIEPPVGLDLEFG